MAEVEEVLRRCKEELILSIYANTFPYHYYYFDNTTYTAINNTTTTTTAHSSLPTHPSYYYPPYATTITTTTTEDSGAVFGDEGLHPSLTTSTEWDLNWTSTEQTTDDNYYYHHQLRLHYQNIRLCRDCNFTSEEVSILFASGTCSPSDYSYMPLIYVMYGAILLAALLGNSLVLHTVTANRKMHTVTNLFIANLAVGDLLIMVFCVPFSVASIMVLQYWPFGAALCVFVNYSQAVSIFVSAYTLVAISLDRYLAIIYPLRPRMTRCQAKVIIGVVWAMALLTTLPIPLVSGLYPIEDNRVYQHYGYQVCREIWGSEMLRKYYTMALMVLQYFIPLIVIIFTYSRIACKVWGCGAMTPPGHSPSHHLQSQMSRPGDPSRTLLRKNTSDHSPAKMIRMTLTVVMVYSLCWLPFNTLMVILDFLAVEDYWLHTHHVWFVFHWLAMSHACYNPLILCWMNTKFRQGYLRALYRLLPCCRPRLSHHLLELRQSSSLQRAHTYSSAFGSTRGGSRNNRNSVTERVAVGQNGRDHHHHHLHHQHQHHHHLQPPADGNNRVEVCYLTTHTLHPHHPHNQTHTHTQHHGTHTHHGESRL